MARVTQAELEYEGSIAIDPDLLRVGDIFPYERVEIYNVENGLRFATYAIEGTPGSREFCVNGAAARLVHPGDRIIIATYTDLEKDEIPHHKPRVVLMGEDNIPKNL